MDKILNKVLTACIGKAREGENLNVFDLMYETSLPYPELKDILDRLASENELVQLDLKTYKFIGDTDRELKTVEAPRNETPFEPEFISDALAENKEYLAKRRQEIIEMMRRKQEEQEEEELFEEEPVGDLSDYVINVFQEKLNPDVFIEPPLHPSWDSRNEFMQSCADHLIILMNSDKQMGRLKAIKKARILLSELQKKRNNKTAEIYEYIL